jgi:hypothetical protein
MTARERLVGLRRTLASVLAARAILAGASVAIVLTAIRRAFPLSPALDLAAVAAGAVVAASLLQRARGARSLERVALWVEERHPSLRYAVVTALEQGGGESIEAQARAVPWWEEDRRRLLATLVRPAAIFLAALAVLTWAPVRVRQGVVAELGRAGAPGRTGAVDALAHIRVEIVPPRYANRPTARADDPTTIEALAGSAVTVTGDGDAARVAAALDSAPRAIASRRDGWSLAFAMPSRPALLRLRSLGGRERLVVVAPVLDAPPAVTLLLPARDTVVRAASGTLVLRAQLRDDIGLRDAAFELIVSSGQEENFTFRSTTLARATLGGRAESTLEARLSLDSLALKPGDMVQLRAVAHDANDATGPGVGSSETRALRVARAGEYDSVAVDAAPPGDPEGQVLSQRMLITLAEALQRRRAALARPMLVDESRRIAGDQAKLRRRVGDIVFQRMGAEPLSEEGNAGETVGKLTPEQLLARANEATGASAGSVMDVEGDETPILAINKPLLEAFNAMWDAGRALEQGEPGQALPPMRRALAAIERARQAERIYLRGRPAAVIVDVAHARLAGKDKGSATEREPRPLLDPVARRRGETFARATELLARDPTAAADSLLVMRVGALVDAPALAAALDDAARLLRRGDSVRVALAWARVRRALGGEPRRRDSIPAWGGAP